MDSFEPSTDQDSFRQGDVVRFLPQAARSDEASLGIVVTADCDLAHGKHQGTLSIVPSYSLDTYLHRFAFAPLANDRAAAITKGIHDALTSHDATLDISPTELESWLARTPTSITTKALAKSVGQQELSTPDSWLGVAIEQVHLLKNPKRTDCQGYCSLLADARRFSTPAKAAESTSPRMEESARSQIRKALDPAGQLPLDFFATLNPGPNLSGIYYANLRRIEALDPNTVSLGLQDSDTSDNIACQRVSRLVPVVRYALTQRMASLFSRIGIPDSIEDGITQHITAFLEPDNVK